MRYDIPHIYLTVEKQPTLTALDSGSSITAISHKKFLELRRHRHLPLHPSPKLIKVANSESLKTSGFTNLNVTLNGKVRSVKVDVIPDFMFDFLVGWPHMKHWGTRLDTASNTATLANESFPFLRTSQRVFHNPSMKSIVTTETFRIPSACSMLVPSKIENFQSGTTGVIVTDPAIAEQGALFVAKGIPVVDDNGNTQVLIANMGSEDVQLPSNTQVAKLATEDEYHVMDTNSLCNVMDLADDSSDEISSKIRQWIETSESKDIPGLDLNNSILTQAEQHQLKCVLSNLSDRFVSNNQRPGRTSLVEMEIDTGNSKPINQAPYPRGPAQRQFIESTLQENLDGGIIRKSISPRVGISGLYYP